MFHGSQPALQSDPGFAESESTRDHSRFNHEKNRNVLSTASVLLDHA